MAKILSPHSVRSSVEEGYALLQRQDYAAARRAFLEAIAADPNCAMAYNNLGWVDECLGQPNSAIENYRRATTLEGDLPLPRVNLASLLAKEQHMSEAMALWRPLIDEGRYDQRLLDEAINGALGEGDIRQAAQWAELNSTLRRGRPRAALANGSDQPRQELAPAMLTSRTLAHDIAQIDYLKQRGGCNVDLDDLANRYRRVQLAVESSGNKRRRPLTDEEQDLIGETYGRIWNFRPTPGIGSTRLLGDWNPGHYEQAYRDCALGICVIDNFLSRDALQEIRQFCLESTVWLANHYGHGRLGAFFREGFNCPLLIDLAEEIARAFPNLIGDTHKLLQLWGFKYSPSQPITHAHADFAAVNLNFWITPDDANLAPETGGLVVYDVEAPPSWTHEDYNRKGQEISAFLRQARARSIYIPYRANRAVLFNSDLFHSTAPLEFRQDYEYRRINVTLLFGRRLDDDKRPIRRL